MAHPPKKHPKKKSRSKTTDRSGGCPSSHHHHRHRVCALRRVASRERAALDDEKHVIIVATHARRSCTCRLGERSRSPYLRARASLLVDDTKPATNYPAPRRHTHVHPSFRAPIHPLFYIFPLPTPSPPVLRCLSRGIGPPLPRFHDHITRAACVSVNVHTSRARGRVFPTP